MDATLALQLTGVMVIWDMIFQESNNMLAIAHKSYDDQGLNKPSFDGNVALATRQLKKAVQAYEKNSKKKLITYLQKAYANLPHTQLGTQIAADIVESYLQLGEYEQVIATADEIQRQGYYMATDNYVENYDLFRIFANKAEAHEAMGDAPKTRNAREKALDYHLESNPTVDVEMLQLFSR